MTNFERGEAYFKLRNYDKAIEYFNLTISDIMDGDLISLSNIYICIAYCYIQLEDIPKAIDTLNKSLDYLIDEEVYCTLGELYFEMGNYKKSYINYKTALAYGIEDQDVTERLDALENILFKNY